MRLNFGLSLAATATATGLALLACSGINDSWEVKGGGYVKYRVNDGESYTIELGPDDVEIPYIRNSHHYFFFRTRPEESSRGDQFSIMVNRPVLGDNAPVEGTYSWFISGNSDMATIYSNSNVHFDQKDDSTWTADLDLYATNCLTGRCNDSLPRVHITGRFRYWIPLEDR